MYIYTYMYMYIQDTRCFNYINYYLIECILNVNNILFAFDYITKHSIECL